MMNGTTTDPTPPEGTVAGPNGSRTIVRLRDDRIVAGVASGIARHFNVDPWLVRIIGIVLVAVGGAGLLLYAAGWVLLPEEGSDVSLAEEWLGDLRGSSTWIGVGLILIAAVWIATATSIVSAGLAWAVALLVLGVLLYRGSLTPQSRSDEPPSMPAPPDTASEIPPVAAPIATVAMAESAAEPVSEPRPKRRRHRRAKSVLGRLTVGTAFVTVGVIALLDALEVITPAFRHYLVALVGVIGLGLLVGTFVGRSRGLIVLGVILLPVLVASAAVTAPFTGGFGDPVHQPLSIGEVQAPYRLAAGEMTLDLSHLDIGDGEAVEIEASVAAGRLLVLVPSGVGVTANAHVGFGQADLYYTQDDGIDVDRILTRDGEGMIVLHLDVGFGQLELVNVQSVPIQSQTG